VKEIIAIIRPKKISATKEALASLGFPGITVSAVLGRGKQRGIAGEISYQVAPEVLLKGENGSMQYIPKRLISIIVEDDMVTQITNVIVKVNQSREAGDGKIFVCPIDEAVRVRTGESGNLSLR
jgi:nitrogen regulatory protein PII 2